MRIRVNWPHVIGMLFTALLWGIALEILNIPTTGLSLLVSFVFGMVYGILFPLVEVSFDG